MSDQANETKTMKNAFLLLLEVSVGFGSRFSLLLKLLIVAKEIQLFAFIYDSLRKPFEVTFILEFSSFSVVPLPSLNFRCFMAYSILVSKTATQPVNAPSFFVVC